MQAGRAFFAGAFLLLSGAAGAVAHELGTIRTFATFHGDGTFAVELILDREHLPPGFGTGGSGRAGFVQIEGLTPALDPKVGAILRPAVAGARPAFDGRAVPVHVELVRNPGAGDDAVAAAAELRLRMTGRIPAGAKAFTWSNAVRLGTYMLTLESEGDQNVERQWLENGAESQPFALAATIVPPTRAQVVVTYLRLGFTHILPKGTDHILFVLGIFLLSTRLKPVMLQVTAFTVAHTITLALTIYGVVSLARSVVEPLIALSIVYVAVENVTTSELKPWRVALVFAFGLLHGMGFAGVLTELGLPRSEFVPALLSFNLGVEGGQLTVIGIALLLCGLPFREKAWYRARVVVPASIAIAAVGFYWAVERLVGRV
jgi:hydrogenase/urease accessory protein HupE